MGNTTDLYRHTLQDWTPGSGLRRSGDGQLAVRVGACLRTWTGIPLCVKLGDDVPLPYTFTAFCAMSANRTNEGILALLENQNKLDTSLWKIVARRNEGGGALLTIGIDGTGREGIEALNYQLAFRFGKITVSGLRKSRADDSLKEPSKFSEE